MYHICSKRTGNIYFSSENFQTCKMLAHDIQNEFDSGKDFSADSSIVVANDTYLPILFLNKTHKTETRGLKTALKRVYDTHKKLQEFLSPNN